MPRKENLDLCTLLPGPSLVPLSAAVPAGRHFVPDHAVIITPCQSGYKAEICENWEGRKAAFKFPAGRAFGLARGGKKRYTVFKPFLKSKPAGDEMAKGHYQKLPVHADACIQCGHCSKRCPFRVDQMARMKEISGYFGK